VRIRSLWLAAIFLATFLAAAIPGSHSARADDFELPGLANDSNAYQSALTRRHPAGGNPALRRAAEQQAAAAAAKKDWNAVAAALEERASLGDVLGQQWLDLAAAQLRRTPPDAKKALAAAWQNFTNASGGEEEIPSLLIIARALRVLDRGDQMIEALQQVVERAPDNADYKRMLVEAQRAVGLTVRRVRAEPESDPPRACVAFSVPPVHGADFNAQDWVRLDPPVPGAAVTREADQICVSGLPSGATTRIVLRAGLPGEQGLSLTKETVLAVAMANRKPAIAFDTRLFVLPRGQAPAVSLTTVNLSAVSLKLMRLTERNVPAFLRDVQLGQSVERYQATRIGEDIGRVVWEGRAEIPKWVRNKNARTALPFPDALLTAGPGLYALLATPGDGTRAYDAAATQVILRTDLAPTIWRGADGLTVQIRGYGDAKPKSGVRLQLLAKNNDILGEVATDADGVGRFGAPLTHGEGPLAPAVIHAFGPDDDFAALDLSVAAFDLSDRGVEGAPHPGPLDAFVWLDRGIYRPGETVQVMALLRDDAGAPADFPAHVTIKRPNGQTFLDATPARAAEASLHLPVTLSNSAAAGVWTVEVRSDPKADPIGRAQFRVDAFVPDRMAVEFGTLPAMLITGQTTNVPVAARFLYGAPGAGLSGTAKLMLTIDPAPFPALAGYKIGLIDEAYAPDRRDLALPDTDAKGQTNLAVVLGQVPDTTRALKAEISVEVNDPSGHGSRAAATIPVRPANPLIGIKPAFADDSVDAGSEAGFDILAVQPNGSRMAMPAKLRLVRERPNWRVVMRGGLARYETVFKDEPLETRDIALAADAPFHFAKKLDFGRYRIEVAQAGGMAVTSYRFRSGWSQSDSPDVPDRVDVSVDRQSIPVGQNARIHISAPFAGEATLLVVSDRVQSLRTVSVAADGTDVDVPVDESWGPGAYVAVHVFRGATGSAKDQRPGRAIGLTWVGVDPAARALPLAIAAVDRYPPRARASIALHTAPGAGVSLAAIDEGILRLTRFESPDPKPHFLGRRTLAVDIRDDWGRLIAPAEGEATLLRQGGDEGSFVLPETPTRTVTLFTPPVQADANGDLTIPLDIPDFNGQVRLMAVGWKGRQIGAANADIIVRDALVAEPLLPRFLAPGDEARLAVLLHNLDLPAGESAARITLDGPLALGGSDRLAAMLAPGAQAVPTTILRATGAGRGVIHLDITGPSGFHITRDTAIIVRPSRGSITQVAGGEIAPGADAALAVPVAAYVPGTWRAVATFGAPVRYDTAGLVQALVDYPLSCLEQATSRGFPLALLPDGPAAGLDRAGRLQTAVQSVLDRQRYDGGFALWSAAGDAEPWLTPYAFEFLLRARRAGAVVPDSAVSDALKFLTEAADTDADSPETMAAQAYRLYVLALGGQGQPGAARVLAEQIDKLPTPLAKAQLGAALALGHDQPRAEAAFAAALAAPARRFWYKDYGSALRDQAAMVVLLKESGLLGDRLARLTAGLPGSDLNPATLSTQEQAWTAAAAAVLGRDGRPARITIDGKALASNGVQTIALTAPGTAHNDGDRPVFQSVAVTGVPVQAPPAARSQMRVTRKFFNLDGTTLDLDQLKQNMVFVMLLEGAAEDGQEHHVSVLQGLPAGWEIGGRLAAGDVAGMGFLGKLTETEAEPAADDRYAAVVGLTAENRGFRVAVKLRAVTPGSYEFPGAEVTDMYRPSVFARQGTNRIKVLAPE
jgi:uncharacterized protein YfaS (alpha-2-macroglobulin family)